VIGSRQQYANFVDTNKDVVQELSLLSLVSSHLCEWLIRTDGIWYKYASLAWPPWMLAELSGVLRL